MFHINFFCKREEPEFWIFGWEHTQKEEGGGERGGEGGGNFQRGNKLECTMVQCVSACVCISKYSI